MRCALAHGRGAMVLEARADERQVVFGVRDEGDGFPAQLRPRAFERFTRGDEAPTGASAGLGLAIVEAIAAAHGGSVAARDDPCGGAVVELALPA